MPAAPFPERPRFDARDKVLGATAYAADVRLPRLLFAMTAPSTIAKGVVPPPDTAAALRIPGVVRVLTATDFPPPPEPAKGEEPPPGMITTEIAYRGQPVALVVAETLEAAIEGAEAIRQTPTGAPFIPLIDSPGAESEAWKPSRAGDAAQALAASKTAVDRQYVSPAQHHNPIEMLSTTAQWQDGKLTIYEATQSAGPTQAAVAKNLRLELAQVEVKSAYVGGAFGQKGSVQRQASIVGHAAMLLGRPVKLVMPRGQIFHNATFRPKSRHHFEIGVGEDGRMNGIRYHADQQQSRKGQFPAKYSESPPMMYGVADYDGVHDNVRIDTQDPGFMRAPHPHPSQFAMESAIDELAYELGRDPVEFRLAHHATTDPISGHPLSSCHLNECLTEGARRFGWARRNMAPGSMTLPDGTLVGWGVAAGAYPVNTTATIARLRVSADGRTRFAVSAHEFGQGIRTVIAQLLIRELGIDPAKLDIAIGDTEVAPQHTTAGSWGTASVVLSVEAAAAAMKAKLVELLDGRAVSGDVHRQLAAVRRPYLEVEVSGLAPGQPAEDLDKLRKGGRAIKGPEYPTFTSYSYIAHFVEVHVEPRTRRVRVPRVVSVADCGRVVSPRTAASQVRGGVVMGLGSALREETEVDPRYGGWLNNDLADYVVSVNADIGDIEVAFVDNPDPLISSVGAKGLGEVSIVGCAGAVANAIHHATGLRVRKMPIRIEDLLKT